jgi:hypothetical protein
MITLWVSPCVGMLPENWSIINESIIDIDPQSPIATKTATKFLHEIQQENKMIANHLSKRS